MFAKKGDDAVLAKIADAPEHVQAIGERLHSLIRQNAPSLQPIVRWGLPFYTKDGQDLCYLKLDKDFIVFGFDEATNPAFEKDANMHPVAWTITSLDEATEATIVDLLTKAAG